MNKDNEYQNETHKLFGEGLIRLAEEQPNTKPTKAALAKFLKLDPSYLKNDGSIKWHLDIIYRCKIATNEFMRQKDVRERKKKQRDKSTAQKQSEKVTKLTKELEEVQERLNVSREKELYLYQAWKGAQEKLDEIENNSMAALAINNSWRT